MYKIRFKRGDSESYYTIESETVRVENSLINLLNSIGIDERYFLKLILNLIKNKELTHFEYLRLVCNIGAKLLILDVDVEDENNNVIRENVIIIIICDEEYNLVRLIISDYRNIYDILYNILKSYISKENKIKIYQRYFIFFVFGILKNILREVSEEVEVLNGKPAWIMKGEGVIIRWFINEDNIEVLPTKKIL